MEIVPDKKNNGEIESTRHYGMRDGIESMTNDPARPKKTYTTHLAKPQTKEHVPSENFEASNTADLKEGQTVEHMKFGFGTITRLEGAAHNPIATIIFQQNGEKKIMLNYAKLRIVENE